MTNADNHIRPDLKVGKLAKLAFQEYLRVGDAGEIARLQDGEYCHQTFRVNATMPVLVPVDIIANAPEGKRAGQADFYHAHYWNLELEFNGVRFRVVNDWHEPSASQPRDNRTPLEDWIRRMGIRL